jgi:hypothetical protein
MWRDVQDVWIDWLARIRKRTDGAAFGARVRAADDPEAKILAAHQQRMRSILDAISGRHSISPDTIVEILRWEDPVDRQVVRANMESADEETDDGINGTRQNAEFDRRSSEVGQERPAPPVAPHAKLPSVAANDTYSGPASVGGSQGAEHPASDTESASRRSESPSDVPRAQGAQVPQESHKGEKPARRNAKYEEIDVVLELIAEAKPASHEEVFRLLDTREAPLPKREPFKSAHGWLKGFQRNSHTASAWLSQAWGRLGLPPFPRGPKK